MSHDEPAPEQWDRVAAELKAYRDFQRETWGDLDNELLGQYLAGELTGVAKSQVEAAFVDHPDLLMLTELVRDVLVTPEPAPLPVEPVPVILSFTAARATRSHTMRRVRHWLPVALAACLLICFFSAPNLSPRGTTDRTAALVADRNDVSIVATESALRQTYQANKNELGDTNPRTLESLNRLSLLYEEVILVNATPADSPTTYYRPKEDVAMLAPPPGGLLNNATNDKTRTLEARKVKESQQLFAHHGQCLPPPAVPVLLDGLEQDKDPALRERCAQTLARMGPAAQDAVPRLTARLGKSESPMESKALAALLAEVRRPAVEAGVHDKVGLYKPATVARLNARLKKVAEEHGLVVVIETVASLPSDRETQKLYVQAWERDRQQRAPHPRTIHVLVAQKPAVTRIALDTTAEARDDECCSNSFAQTFGQAIQKHLKDDRDQGLEQAVQLLEQKLQAKSKR